MFGLVSNPLVVILLILIPVTAFLIYLCVVYKSQIVCLEVLVENGKTEISSLKGYIDNKERKRKLYTFESLFDRIEDVVHCNKIDQHLKITQVNGSVHFVSIPTEYKLIVQDQPEEGKDDYYEKVCRDWS